MNSSQKHILIIDDDKEITAMVSDYLQANNYRVTYAYDGSQIKRQLKENNFDLIILDVMLPGEDGLSLCQTIRKELDVPIIMLSAANTEADKVAGLELGADDYIAKPFGARELLARIKAHMRRAEGVLANPKLKLQKLKRIQFDTWQLDRETHSLIDAESIMIPLSKREYDLMLILLENPRRILSRDQLMDLLYGKTLDPFDRTIDVLVGRLRKKIETDPKKPQLIATIRGGGYQLDVDVKVD
jgi:two-component system OmpR family response regulator